MAAPRPKGGLSLYDNLTDPNVAASATISHPPVVYVHDDGPISDLAVAAPAAAAKKSVDPALRFQPIRRPQAKQANKPKGLFPKAVPKTASAAVPGSSPDVAIEIGSGPSAAPVAPKSSLAAWAPTEEEVWTYGTGEKRQRGGRRNKKKRQELHEETNWDDLYDPARPTNVEEYMNSDERIDEAREWYGLLHEHMRNDEDSDLSSSDGESRPTFTNQFAPPPSFTAFAPPPPSPPAALPDDKSGDDAYARRVALSQAPPQPSPSPPPQIEVPRTLPQVEALPAQSYSDSAIISKAPIRYAQPSEAIYVEDDDEDMEYRPSSKPASPPQDAPRSNRPGQAGFAARIMNKYGWSEGSGLGVDESGMVKPLRVQVEKRRKKADADGGGWAEPGGKGKIIGGKRKEDFGKFGIMSEVIVLQNMLEGMADLQGEVEGGLGQEIGEECGDQYGRVERLYIDQENRQVFIKFTNQVSALRAVNELEGRVFNGNTIVPKFHDVEKFEKGIYV